MLVLVLVLVLVLGAGAAGFVTHIWELYLTWGVLVGLGSSLGMMALAATIANRWFVAHRGLVMGMLTAGNASGQLILMQLLTDRYDSRVLLFWY